MHARSLCLALALVLLCGRGYAQSVMLEGILRDMAPSYMAHGNFPADWWMYNGWTDHPLNGSCGTANGGHGFNNSDFEIPLWFYGNIRVPNAKGGVLYNGETGLVGAVCNANNNWTNCARLGADRKPVYAYPGRSPKGNVQNPDSFYTWFHDSPVSIASPYTLNLTNIGGNTYRFESKEFFPIDGKGWNDWNVADDGKTKHNYGFTLEFHSFFTYSGGERLGFVGTNDFFVFVDNRLVLDAGGIHTAQSAVISLDSIAGLEKGHVYRLDIFFAQRHTTLSEFSLITSSPFCTYRDWCGVCDGDGSSCACNTTSQCDDKDSCTLDTCKSGYCAHTPIACDDNNKCTTEKCDNGTCVYAPIVCDDGNHCTLDSCDARSGCMYTPVACQDNNKCTIDSCNVATGTCTFTPVQCDDNNACTTDTCDAQKGCVYTPKSSC